MKHPLLRLLATLLVFACAATGSLRAQGTALQTELVALARPTTGLVGLTPDGALVRSTDDGATFDVTRAADTDPDPKALYAVAASGDTVVAMGDAGYFVRSTDNGATWSAIASPVTPTFGGAIHALAANGSIWVAVGKRGGDTVILYSEDEGVSWEYANWTPALGELRGVAWSGGLSPQWIAVGGDGVFGYSLTSTDGKTWSAPTGTDYPLNAVASNGSGTVLAVGDAGTILRSTDHGTSFTAITDGDGFNVVSENLRSVTFLTGSTASFIIGGDSATLLSVSGTTPAIVAGPSPDTADPILALLSDGTATGYHYYSAADTTPEPPPPHGPVSLQVALVSGQLQLTLVGAVPGNSYELETSTTLTSWTVVPASTRFHSDGGAAPSWSFALPAGPRAFYRARLLRP